MSPGPVEGFLGIFLRLKRFTENVRPVLVGNRRIMAKQSQNKFIKRKKELDRMRKAKEKMERRQSQKNKTTESDGSQIFEQTQESSNS